jgi:TonB family protein
VMQGAGRGKRSSGVGSLASRIGMLSSALAAVGMTLGATSCGGGGASRRGEPDGQHHLTSSTSAHDGDERDDGVVLASSRGVLEPEQVRAAVEPHSNEVSGCYLSRVGARRWLGGRVTLRWKIAPRGGITDVQIIESDLGAWPVERCLLEVARRMQFPEPRGGPAEFTVPFEFSATGNAQPWDEARSAAAVGDEQLAQLAQCDHPGDASLTRPGPRSARSTSRPVVKAPPKAAGAPLGTPATPPGQAPAALPGRAPQTVTITLYVGARGTSHSVGFAAGEPDGIPAPWAECAEKIAMTWRLPDPRGTVAKLTLRYARDRP